jgi:integrase
LTNNLRRVYKAAVEAAGAYLAHLDPRGPHNLRHTFATWLEDAGDGDPGDAALDERIGCALAVAAYLLREAGIGGRSTVERASDLGWS